MPGRSCHQIKNRFYGTLKKRITPSEFAYLLTGQKQSNNCVSALCDASDTEHAIVSRASPIATKKEVSDTHPADRATPDASNFMSFLQETRGLFTSLPSTLCSNLDAGVDSSGQPELLDSNASSLKIHISQTPSAGPEISKSNNAAGPCASLDKWDMTFSLRSDKQSRQ